MALNRQFPSYSISTISSLKDASCCLKKSSRFWNSLGSSVFIDIIELYEVTGELIIICESLFFLLGLESFPHHSGHLENDQKGQENQSEDQEKRGLFGVRFLSPRLFPEEAAQLSYRGSNHNRLENEDCVGNHGGDDVALEWVLAQDQNVVFESRGNGQDSNHEGHFPVVFLVLLEEDGVELVLLQFRKQELLQQEIRDEVNSQGPCGGGEEEEEEGEKRVFENDGGQNTDDDLEGQGQNHEQDEEH